jgi:hypothetical protein
MAVGKKRKKNVMDKRDSGAEVNGGTLAAS